MAATGGDKPLTYKHRHHPSGKGGVYLRTAKIPVLKRYGLKTRSISVISRFNKKWKRPKILEQYRFEEPALESESGSARGRCPCRTRFPVDLNYYFEK